MNMITKHFDAFRAMVGSFKEAWGHHLGCSDKNVYKMCELPSSQGGPGVENPVYKMEKDILFALSLDKEHPGKVDPYAGLRYLARRFSFILAAEPSPEVSASPEALKNTFLREVKEAADVHGAGAVDLLDGKIETREELERMVKEINEDLASLVTLRAACFASLEASEESRAAAIGKLRALHERRN